MDFKVLILRPQSRLSSLWIWGWRTAAIAAVRESQNLLIQ